MKLFRGQPDHDYWRARITALDKARVWWGLSVGFAYLSFSAWRHPTKPPFTGKLAWLESMMYFNYGSIGVPLLWGIIAAASFIAGVFLWQEWRQQRVDSDRGQK
jgi:hypothetical protein